MTSAQMTPPMRYSFDHEHEHGGNNTFPLASEQSTNPTQYKHQEPRNANYTSPLTMGSKASSVVACEQCVFLSVDCQCLYQSDSGYGEGESIRQPNTPPAERAELNNDVVSYASGGIKFPSQIISQQALQKKLHPLRHSRSPSPISQFQKRDAFPKSSLPYETKLSTPTKNTSTSIPCAGVAFENSSHAVTNASESEIGEDDEITSEEEEEEEEYDWSGQNDDLESIVLKCLAGDLPLAAHLIPILHNALYTELQTDIKRKVGPWRYGVTKCASGGVDGESRHSSSSQGSTSSPGSNHRKRARLSGGGRGGTRKSKGVEDDNEEDDENGDSRNARIPGDIPDSSDRPQLPRLACHFHKWDPAKYSVQYDGGDSPRKLDYRTCAGPGFGNIQRLKEHLKRKHYPVQCGRCFKIFPGADRASALNDLREHARSAVQCDLKSSSLKEGLSDSQWAQLERKKSTKKDQETSTVEKWYAIWAVLFPDVSDELRPKTPWYENVANKSAGRLLSEDSLRFDQLFKTMLRNKVDEGDIRFAPGTTDEMIGRVEVLVHNAFEISAGLYELSSTTTSSSASRLALMYGGLYEHLPNPLLSGAYSSPPAARTISMSGSVGGLNLPTASSRRTNSGNERMAISSIARQGSSSNTVASGIAHDHSVLVNYPIRLSNTMDAFGNHVLDANSDSFFDFQYNSSFDTEAGISNLGRPSMNNASSTNPDHTFIDQSDDNPHLTNMGSWDQFHTGQGYDGAT